MRSRGFTLLEVIVALAILGISAAVILQIFSGGFKNVHRIDLAHRAMEHAENIMNEILSDKSIQGPWRQAGDLDEEFSYTAQVEDWNDPRQGVELQEAELPVRLLSVVVDIHFKNDPHGKLYRTISLKAVSTGAGSPALTTGDVIQRLFGRSRR